MQEGKSRTVLSRSNTGIVVSNPISYMDVFVSVVPLRWTDAPSKDSFCLNRFRNFKVNSEPVKAEEEKEIKKRPLRTACKQSSEEWTHLNTIYFSL
jgi:hypothetical protein